MKKFFLVLLILTVVGGAAFADLLAYPPSLEGKNILIDAGIGLAYTGFISSSSAKMSIPPLFVQVEFCLPTKVPISVGGMFGIFQYKWEWDGYDWWSGNYKAVKYTEKYTTSFFAIRGNWHWNFSPEWLDFYTGVNMGYRYVKWSIDPDRSNYSDPGWSAFSVGLQVGAHFYFTKVFGLMAEVGFPYWIKGGIALKF